MKNWKIDMRKIEKKLKQDEKLEKYIIQKLKMKNWEIKILKNNSNKWDFGKIFWQLVGRHVVALWPVA